LEKGGGTP